ncbi:MAG: hypothetical protein ACAF41_13525 [Leptolyngbya sp. BL-A-14]
MPKHYLAYHGLLLGLLVGLPNDAIAQTTRPPISPQNEALKECLEDLLYDHSFVPKQRTVIPEFIAVKVCRQQPSNPSATAYQLRDCMEDLMYDYTFTPKKRTEVSRVSAAEICAGVE